MTAFNDVTDAFDGWLETVTGERTTGSYSSGRWVSNAPSSLSFPGVVQNALPDDLKVLPEGLRTEEAIKIHTTFNLVAQIEDTTVGDVIFYEGYNWTVYNVANRRIGNYNKAIAIRGQIIP